MAHPNVKSQVEDHILIVSIARPEKRNALTPDMVDALAAEIRTADNDPKIRAVVVHGEGPVFSAGIDLASLGGAMGDADINPARALRKLATRLQDALNNIEALELPVIGALHGQVIGLGLEVALSFDLRVASSDCQLSIPEARVGLVADVGGTTRLARCVGPSRAKDMLLTARSVPAEEALSWGLVNRVVPAAEVLHTALTLAQQIAQNAPLAVGLAKLIVDQGDGLPKHTQMAIERWAQSQLIDTSDVAEAVQAFMEKRAPQFRGK